VSNQSILLFA